MKKHKVAVIGFRHGHILSVINLTKNSPRAELAAACEENDGAREEIIRQTGVSIDYTRFSDMLAHTDCDIVAVGEYYAKRGSVVIEALKHGKHVLSDKPLCTSLTELAEIRRLSAEKHLCIGCMFDLRSDPVFTAARSLILSGKIGKITQIQFSAQHPLRLGTRPAWYFEPGKHGGTINDIAVHGMDLLPWLTGLRIRGYIAARTWKAFVSNDSCFSDAAQFMLTLENGCGVMADVSYSAPDTIGGNHPCYWLFHIWGTKGMLEVKAGDTEIRGYFNGEKSVSRIAVSTEKPVSYWDSFLNEIDGFPADLTTDNVLDTARISLELQALADKYKSV